MTTDEPTPTGRTETRAPRTRFAPQSIALPPGPDRPVNIQVEIDDERGASVRYDIDLSATTADDLDRLAAVLLRGVLDVGQAYLAATRSTDSVQDGTDLAALWRRTLADRAGAL